jgi:hypothetical protein
MSAPKKDPVADLVTKLEAAAYAYHNGLAETMTDAEYDAAIERLETLAPDHPFLKRVGAALPASLAAEEVALPIPLPSLNKAKPGTLAKWLSRHPIWLAACLDKRIVLRSSPSKRRETAAAEDASRGTPITDSLSWVAMWK